MTASWIGMDLTSKGLPCGSAGKESARIVGDLGSIPGLGRSPREGKDYPLQYSGLGNSRTVYSPWGCKESDRTEQLSLSLFIQRQVFISAGNGKHTEEHQGETV